MRRLSVASDSWPDILCPSCDLFEIGVRVKGGLRTEAQKHFQNFFHRTKRVWTSLLCFRIFNENWTSLISISWLRSASRFFRAFFHFMYKKYRNVEKVGREISTVESVTTYTVYNVLFHKSLSDGYNKWSVWIQRTIVILSYISAFSVCAPQLLWITIPQVIKASDNVDLFKKRLKTHLFIEALGWYYMLYWEALWAVTQMDLVLYKIHYYYYYYYYNVHF